LTVPGKSCTVSLKGAGSSKTHIYFRPLPNENEEAFLRDSLYDNASRTNGDPIQSLLIQGVTIHADASNARLGKVGWFRQSGWSTDPNPEQNWSFIDVRFIGDKRFPQKIGSILNIVGDANGSENSFEGCFGRYFKSVIECTNAQAVNHISVGSHWELSIGSVFHFVRGGNLTVIGGSIIVGNFSKIADKGEMTSKQPYYLLDVGGDGSGQINTFNVVGVRVELRNSQSGILRSIGPNNRSVISFIGIDAQAATGQSRETIIMKDCETSVLFSGCSLSSPGGYAEPILIKFDSTSEIREDRPTVTFRDCVLSSENKLATWLKSKGEVRFRDCKVKISDSASDHVDRRIPDADLIGGPSRAADFKVVRSISLELRGGDFEADEVKDLVRARFAAHLFPENKIVKLKLYLYTSHSAELSMRFVTASDSVNITTGSLSEGRIQGEACDCRLNFTGREALEISGVSKSSIVMISLTIFYI